MMLIRRSSIRVKCNRRWIEVAVFLRRHRRIVSTRRNAVRRLDGRLGLFTFSMMREAAE
jgi:hypothetical protein